MTKVLSRNFSLLGKENREDYVKAKPFPHIVLDDIFQKEILEDIISEFPNKNEIDWQIFKDNNQVKLACNDEKLMGEITKFFIHFLNSQIFIEFLEQLTGIKNLIPDPMLEGGGLHQILQGGLLKVHADFNKHPRTNLDRRLNVLVYLNKDWEETYGGHFELWDEQMKEAKIKILPAFNRMAIFSTTSTSYHGHPNPLNCPGDISRKSIAMYYYTNGRPKEEITKSHSTLFQIRKDKIEDRKADIKKFLKDCIPPILTRTLMKIFK